MEKMDGYSLNIVKENVEKLKEIFPEVFCEDKVDFERLQEVLGEYVEDKEERYRFEWHGKSKAIRIAQTPSRGTLRPCKEESKNWDTTENLYIEGDNLEVLKLLQKSYQNKIKMIYIDPPYNTGNDFVYKDDYKDNLKNYLEITGQVDEEGNRTSTNSDAGGRYHTNWLNMMYPRLRLARNLLKDDGVIFISIDENEHDNLKLICDEIFAEYNFAGEIVWKNGSKNDQDYISMQHEYIMFYVRDKNFNKGDWKEKKEGLDDIFRAFEGFYKECGDNWDEIHKRALSWFKQYPESNPISNSKHYTWFDDINGVYFPDNISGPNDGQYVYDILHPITKKPVKKPSRGWFCPLESMQVKIKEGKIHFGKDETTVPCLKTYLKDTQYQSLTSVKFKDGRVASKYLKNLLGGKYFNNPKDSDLLEGIFKSIGLEKEDIVLDFFSGSATTAQAIMKMNTKDNGNRKFILVQIPENIDEKEEAYKAGYKNICEIGKERIRRAGDKIVSENKDKEGIEDLDIGFKVFKLDSSNIKPWNPRFEDIAHKLDEMVDNFVPGRTEEDVVYEIMLKYGIDLTYPIEVREISGKKVFSIGFGALIICLDNEITLEMVNGIVDLKNELDPETTRVVFKDNGFKTDSVKTNAIEILKRNNINENEVMSI
ncbi:site-specific DNA-methyltransferase [Clostridium sporogenes]|uniref:site-specific DNA-methyltransferase n=1 Tax=Clostridium sporogenes TaxID=1509 RepID=UPI003F910990